MVELAPDLFVVEGPQRFFGVEVGSRMTVVRLGEKLLLHSPIAVDPTLVEDLGEARWLMAPNSFHHLHAGPWMERGLAGFASASLPPRRPDLAFEHVITEVMEPWGPEVRLVPTQSMPLVGEVALLHRPSRTLVLTDLVFNLGPEAPWLTRALLRLALGYPGVRSTTLERLLMRRDLARADLAELLALDFDRLVMSHGRVVETGGKDALRRAYAWLGPLQLTPP